MKSRTTSRVSSTLVIVAFVAVIVGCGRDGAVVLPDPALTGRIEGLVDQLIAAMGTGEMKPVQDEARAIFEGNGIPTVARVGDAAAYGFVLVNMLAQPPEFRRQFFQKVQDADSRRELPADAAVFAAARMRQTETAERYRTKAPTHPDLRDELLRLVKEDQAARQRDDFDIKKMEATDRRTGIPLKRILDQFGVPTFDMVGVEAAKSFIVMIQHQPPSFRAATLARLKANVDAGQADPESYATVYDRTQDDLRKNQFYGQNFKCAGASLEAAPLDDPAAVNTRRAEMGLMRLELYARLLRANSPDICK